MRTGVLVVTHNSASHIGACLDSLAGFDPVLVVDNASSDATVSVARLRHGVRVIANTANLGFAGGVNLGFQLLSSETDRVLILNPDVQLVGPLDLLEAACDETGLAGGRLADETGAPQTGFTVRRFPTPAALFFETVGMNRLWPRNPVNRRYRYLDLDLTVRQTVDQPAGAMLLIRNDVWQRIGGMDEDFHPVWFEDVDFCRRAARAGFRASYVPQVTGIHTGGHSVLQIPELRRRQYWYASLLRYSRKHHARGGRALVAGGVLAAAGARMVGALLRGSREQAGLYWSIVRLVGNRMGKPGINSQSANEVSAGAANVRSRVAATEGIPSIENTERTLKRLHARS